MELDIQIAIDNHEYVEPDIIGDKVAELLGSLGYEGDLLCTDGSDTSLNPGNRTIFEPPAPLTAAEEERQDLVDNGIHNLIADLAGKEVEWDQEKIAKVREAVQEVVCKDLKAMTEDQFYPWLKPIVHKPDSAKEVTP